MKKKSGLKVVIIGIIAILGVLGLCVYRLRNSENWQSLTVINGYEKLLDSPINKIVLRKTVDSAEWVEITDSDLIDIWIDFFHNLELKKENSVANREMNGGHSVIEIWTDIATYSIYLEENKFEIDGKIYAIRESDSIPFSQTYDIAVERHGIKSPWGK